MSNPAAKTEVLILGQGLAGLIVAARLKKLGHKNITLVGNGHGGSPEIAALNAVMPGSPHNDSVPRHIDDMMRAGYGVNDKALLVPMCSVLPEAVRFLEDIGATFTRENGFYKLRQTSGCSCPRSLCDTGMIMGKRLLPVLVDYVKDTSVFIDGQAVELLTNDNRIAGAVILTPANETLVVDARVVVAAWGGVGDLFPNSTYRQDVDGSGLAAAWKAGLPLIDLEFLEYEPLVTLHPESLFGEPCPTAILADGAYLLNSDGERFLLKKLPEGESGAGKSLINKAIGEERAAGRTTARGGVFADMRHLSEETLNAYPWFNNRMLQGGVDVRKELLEVGPVAHSHSGGILVDPHCKTAIRGLYVVGEASGGYHGACRMGGNAASQTLGTGFICAEQIAAEDASAYFGRSSVPTVPVDLAVRRETREAVHKALDAGMNLVRTAQGLRQCLDTLAALEKKASADVLAAGRVTAAKLVSAAALAREESRGTHTRGDFPKQGDEAYALAVEPQPDGAFAIRRITRSEPVV